MKISVEDQVLIGGDLLKKLTDHNETIVAVYNDLAFIQESTESMRKKETGEVQLKVLKELESNCNEMDGKLDLLRRAFDGCRIPEGCSQDALNEDINKLQSELAKIKDEVGDHLQLYDLGSACTVSVNSRLDDLETVLHGGQEELNLMSGDVSFCILDCGGIDAKFDELSTIIGQCNSELSLIMGEIDSAKSKGYPISELVLSQHVGYLSEQFENLESDLSEIRLRNNTAMRTFESLKKNAAKIEEYCAASEKAIEANSKPTSVKAARDSTISLDVSPYHSKNVVVACKLTNFVFLPVGPMIC